MAEAGLEVSVGGLTLISLELYRYAYCSDLGDGIAGGGWKKKVQTEIRGQPLRIAVLAQG